MQSGRETEFDRHRKAERMIPMKQSTLTHQDRWSHFHAIALGVPVGSMLERRASRPTVAVTTRLETAGRRHPLQATWRLTASGDRLEMVWQLRAA